MPTGERTTLESVMYPTRRPRGKMRIRSGGSATTRKARAIPSTKYVSRNTRPVGARAASSRPAARRDVPAASIRLGPTRSPRNGSSRLPPIIATPPNTAASATTSARCRPYRCTAAKARNPEVMNEIRLMAWWARYRR